MIESWNVDGAEPSKEVVLEVVGVVGAEVDVALGSDCSVCNYWLFGHPVGIMA